MCLVSMVVKECRFNVNLVCLPSQGLDEASKRNSCLKDRRFLYDVYHRARKVKFCASRLREDARVHMTLFG